MFQKQNRLRLALVTASMAFVLFPGGMAWTQDMANTAPLTAAAVLTDAAHPFEPLSYFNIVDFAEPGKVYVKDQVLYLEKGNSMTGVQWPNPPARMNYEIELDAQRVEGEDFFCCLTFPYNDTACSLVAGGWHCCVVGLSSVDYEDAANNATTRSMQFDNGRWYAFRVRVTPDHIEAWIDDAKVVDLNAKGRHITTRWEVEPCEPMGLATYETTGAIRDIRVTKLDPETGLPLLSSTTGQ